MKKSIMIIFFALSVILSGQASGYSLYFTTSGTAVGLNETTAVGIWISGLGNYAAPNLGAYDLEIGFDPNVLRFESLSFSSFLGFPGSSISSFGLKTPGVLSVRETSLLNGVLSSLQPGSFSLVNIQFTLTALQGSTLSFLSAGLSDGDGYSLYADLQSANLYAVPIPSSLLLLSGAVLGLGAYRRKRFKA
jgi:hypothetical protein